LIRFTAKWELGDMKNRLRIDTGTLSAGCREPNEE
jgi:hypothetical protein